MGSGQLDIVLPVRTRDEFGALTNAFNRMVRRVREMIQARDRLLLDVSHELRSPLTRMKVALEFLPEGESKEELATDICEMESMVAELLELERLRVILGWASAVVFFTAVMEISELGHKPLGFALYSNAVHFALWVLALPIFAKCIRRFRLRDPNRLRNVGVRLIFVAVLALAVTVVHWAIICS